MTTAFLAIAASIRAALAADLPLADGRVFLNRLRPLPVGAVTALVVRLEQSRAQEEVIGAHDWDTGLVIECYARGTSDADPDDAVHALLVDAWARLAALDSGALGVMSIALNPAIDWQYDDADGAFVCASVRLQVTHRTLVFNLNSWS